jgi:hypothetical protein
MEKLFNSTFDFFSYAIPGCLMLFAVMLLDTAQNSLPDYLTFIGTVNIAGGVVIVLLGYIVGFALNPLGRHLYRTIGFRLFPPSFDDFKGLSVSDKYALLRDMSPANFKYVETWNMHCTSAHNAALAMLMMVVFGTARMLFSFEWFFLYLVISGAVLFFFLLHRAVTFYIWAASDINAAIRSLHLKARADAKS